MVSLESLTAGTLVRGVIADGDVEVITAKWFGDSAVELTYKVPDTGLAGIRLLYRDDEVGLHIVERGLPWSFDGDGDLFRLISEAQRIGLAHLFDPVLAVHNLYRRSASPPDHGGIRGDAAAPTPPLPAGR